MATARRGEHGGRCQWQTLHNAVEPMVRAEKTEMVEITILQLRIAIVSVEHTCANVPFHQLNVRYAQSLLYCASATFASHYACRVRERRRSWTCPPFVPRPTACVDQATCERTARHRRSPHRVHQGATGSGGVASTRRGAVTVFTHDFRIRRFTRPRCNSA